MTVTARPNHGQASIRHAGSLYRRVFRSLLRPIHEVEAEAHHLHEVEREGVSGETPFVAIVGLILFFLPIVAVMLGLALLAVYVAG